MAAQPDIRDLKRGYFRENRPPDHDLPPPDRHHQLSLPGKYSWIPVTHFSHTQSKT
jgi:hypothetical protein